jgi:hypothetical protein
MRTLIIILILISGSVLGQKTHTIIVQGQDKPKEKPDFDILMGCGVAGTVSYQLTSTEELVKNKNYPAIKKNLYSRDLLTQLTSVIVLEELSRRSLVALSKAENEVITKFKSSKKTYYFCNGCTGHYYGTIADIFSHDTKDKSLLNIQRNIKRETGLEKH